MIAFAWLILLSKILPPIFQFWSKYKESFGYASFGFGREKWVSKMVMKMLIFSVTVSNAYKHVLLFQKSSNYLHMIFDILQF